MSENKQKTEIVPATIFAPTMTIDQAITAFDSLAEFKTKLLKESDYAMLQVNVRQADGSYKSEIRPFTRKSGWNKLAVFLGASTRTISSKKIWNPDGSYEWQVTVEAYKIDPDTNKEIYRVQRSAIVSSTEKEKTEKMKKSERKSHDVFASCETRAEGRTLASYFGTGEVSAEELEEGHQVKQADVTEYCNCSYDKMELTSDEGGCRTCHKKVTEIRKNEFKKAHPGPKTAEAPTPS